MTPAIATSPGASPQRSGGFTPVPKSASTASGEVSIAVVRISGSTRTPVTTVMLGAIDPDYLAQPVPSEVGIGNALATPFPASWVMHEGEGRTYEVTVDAARQG